MFDVLKLYKKKIISLSAVITQLVQLGYTRCDEVYETGDFMAKGDTLEIFPANFSYPVRVEWDYEVIDKMYSYDKGLRKKMMEYDFLMIIPFTKKQKKYSEEIPLDALLRIKKGDYVVHVHYGIGRFMGLRKISIKEKEDYYFVLEYADKDIVYVSREDMHLIQKYVTLSVKKPKLSKLGTKEWTRTRLKVEAGIRNFAWELIRLEAQRQVEGGIAYAADVPWQEAFERSFPYQETRDQLNAVNEVKYDMEQPQCMDRLICGDVGYGKTEVAMRAAFKAVMGGKQVAFLVPTTILARQHYTSLIQRIAPFPVEVEMLSRFRSGAEQVKILQRLAQGKIDIVVGTHRLLSDDVAFKDLGLLIVDEEQRFGVRHKDKLKKLKAGIDVLMLTATPIPRTLYMSLIGIKNISIIRTPPRDRIAINTKVDEFDKKLVKNIILREYQRGGQTFIIHNRIETIYKVYKEIEGILPKEVSIGVIHGRLPTREIERVMLRFLDKKLDCLLSTAIIESGIDVPSANTIIINDAHTFGMADLHQLRGRVGRFNVQAYAHLLVPRYELLSSEVKKRLHLIEEFSHLGAGFDVAMSDLELRGAGNLLGKEQHGFIWMIGFDLYCRILKKEIEYLKHTLAKGDR